MWCRQDQAYGANRACSRPYSSYSGNLVRGVVDEDIFSGLVKLSWHLSWEDRDPTSAVDLREYIW